MTAAAAAAAAGGRAQGPFNRLNLPSCPTITFEISEKGELRCVQGARVTLNFGALLTGRDEMRQVGSQRYARRQQGVTPPPFRSLCTTTPAPPLAST
jgi:hypothetical protein